MSNYDNDDGDIIGNFFSERRKKETIIENNLVPEPNKHIILDNIERNLLYNIASYIITSTITRTRICSKCLNSAGSRYYDINKKYATFVQLRCFRKNALFFVNNDTFTYFYNMEVIICQYLPFVPEYIMYNFVTFYMNKMKPLLCPIKLCHNLLSKIMKRFIYTRMRISCKKGKLKNKE